MQILEQVITLLKIARHNKMLVIDEDGDDPAIKLEPKCQASLRALVPTLPDFSISQSLFHKLILSEDFKIVLSCIEIVSAETKASLPVTKFELQLCDTFIRHGLRTTFPEFRQKYIKAVKNFLIRLRTTNDKDIKKPVASAALQEASAFLLSILGFIEENLYLDKPVEAALPYFELMKIIFELFGDFEYKLRVSQIYPACHLLSKLNYFDESSRASLFLFLVNSMKSTWAQVRMDSFFILCHFPDAFPSLNDPITVNDLLLTTARDLANNPKAMLAEASALFLNLVFKKCLRHVSVVPAAVREGGNL